MVPRACSSRTQLFNRRSDDEVYRTFDALDAALQPFLQNGWLTTLDTTTPGSPPKRSALTIVVTGNVPMPSIMNSQGPLRYIFYDAPLKGLEGDPEFDPTISVMASASFSSLVGSRWVIPRLAKQKILEYVNMAHSKGIAVRVTEPIDFPVWIRYVVCPPPYLSVRLTNVGMSLGICIGKCC